MLVGFLVELAVLKIQFPFYSSSGTIKAKESVPYVSSFIEKCARYQEFLFFRASD